MILMPALAAYGYNEPLFSPLIRFSATSLRLTRRVCLAKFCLTFFAKKKRKQKGGGNKQTNKNQDRGTIRTVGSAVIVVVVVVENIISSGSAHGGAVIGMGRLGVNRWMDGRMT